MQKELLFVFLFTIIPIKCQHVFIVIHGTWSSETEWYMPGGDFFDALEITAHKQNATVVPFHWSGAITHQAREKAAINLAKLIETYDQATDITVIGHSHGGNVAILASHQLKKNKIFCLYTLGTPINPIWYPNMNMIEYCYNLFSFEDLIQPVFGLFEREYALHDRIANVRVTINNKHPDHTGLHHKLIGTWLPYVHEIISNSAIQRTEPGVLHFTDVDIPHCMFDEQRQNLLERDKRLSLLILHSLSRNHKISSPECSCSITVSSL